MIAKTFEVRDAGTFIPVIAVKLEPGTEADRYLIGRSGYGRNAADQAEYVLLCQIDGGDGQCTSDPFSWRGGYRTMKTAHQHIDMHFDELPSGAVVDVQYILGETPEPKASESAQVPY